MLLTAICAPSLAFTASARPFGRTPPSTLFSSSTTDTEDDILKPSYEIEPIAFRIGHGFDIHRMAPLDEAGQPVVIGGVTIDHKPQKVRIIARDIQWKKLPDFYFD